MPGHSKWSDIRPQVVAELGGEPVVTEARRRQQAYIDAYRLAERRTALGLTQVEVAQRMGVTKGRVSQIERGEVSTVDVIARYVQAIGGQVPVLADGSFRRGTDIVKALGFGAKGVLVGRPVMWGLAAYGADGVQGVVEMLQTELARYMCMCGRPTLAAVDASLVRVHAALSTTRNNHG